MSDDLGGTHCKKVLTDICSAISIPFLSSLQTLFSFDLYISAKTRKMYFHPYFLSNFDRVDSFDPLFGPL